MGVGGNEGEEGEVGLEEGAITGREVMRRKVPWITIAITGREVVSLGGTVLRNSCSKINVYFFITFDSILSTQILCFSFN